MSSPIPRRFQTHDRVVFEGNNAVAELTVDAGPSITSVGKASSLAGGSGAFATSLEKAGLSVSDRSKAVERTQGHKSVVDRGSGELKPRHRNGASVRKITPVDDSGKVTAQGAAVTALPPMSPTSPSLTLSPSPPVKARLLPGESPPTTPPKPQTTPEQGSPAKRATGDFQAAQFVLQLDEASAKAGSYSPRTQMLLRARQNKDAQTTIRKPKTKSKLARTASQVPSSIEGPAPSPPTDGDADTVPSKLKITSATLQEIRRKADTPKFGQRRPREEDPCILILLWRVWRHSRAEARRKHLELMKLLNSPVFVDGPCGHVVGLCGFSKLQLQEFARMYHLELDIDETGCVTSGSFLDWAGVLKSTFNKSIFQLISQNLTLSGKLKQFDDFLVAIITFCLFTQADLLRFLFNSIDADESGSVNEEEYLALLEMMTTGEGNSFPGSFKRMLEAVDVNKDGAIQFDEFLALAQRFPLAMFPLFQFQIQVQAATLGQEGWMKVKRRVDLMLEAAAMTVTTGGKK